MPSLRRYLISTSVLAGLAVGVGYVLSGDDAFDWWLTAGLVALVVAGEGARVWIRYDRGKRSTATRT